MRKYWITIVLSLLCGFIGAMAGVHFLLHGGSTSSPSSVRDRVLKSGVIRAAYLVRPPNIVKNPNDGKLSGIFVDIMEEAGRRAGLRVEWVEEVTWGTMIEGLNSGRYDIVATGIWRNATRGKAADFTMPLFYSGVGVFVRSDDHRFDGNLGPINNPSVRVAAIDGEMAEIIAKSDFPQAHIVSLTQISDTSQLLLEVQSGKSDVTFLAMQIGARYIEKNPTKVRNIAITPIRIFPESMVIKAGEYDFRSMIDSALIELVNSTFIEQTIRKYDSVPESYYLVATPYRPNR
jgi:polar amino acid transport system substrate-binding protein